MVSISCILKSCVTYSSVVRLRVKSLKVRRKTRVFSTSKRRSRMTQKLNFELMTTGVLWFQHRLVVPKDRELKNRIMDEAHLSKLSIHPGSSKMYQDLRPHFWWTKMKKEIATYVARCDTCCRVKAIHMKPAGLLQPLSVPEWKWEEVSKDFITGLPTTRKGNDSIWVIIDRLTKSAHFIPVKIHTDLPSMLIYIWLTLSSCMVFPRPSYQIEDHSSPLTSGSECIRVWGPV